MPTLSAGFVVQWRVDNGPPRTVQYVNAYPYQVYVPDGASTTDIQTILDYIMTQDAKQQPDLMKLARQGLLTLVAAPSIKIVIPPVPPP